MGFDERIVQMNDKQVEFALNHQVRDPDSRHNGGIVNPSTGIPNPSHVGTAGYIASIAASLVVPRSVYFRDQTVLVVMERAVQYMLNRQHSDGTISLGGTNFHSPPDTGFVVTGLCQVYRVLELDSWAAARPVLDGLHLFLKRSIPALMSGGCHTPNHRWVITAALSSLYDLFQMPELKMRAERWLSEGIDCTEDGEWTERSNGIYNTVSNIMLIYTAIFLQREDLLTHVRRNLQMMVYMMHHDGKVVTDYSDRQDLGIPHDLSEYFLSYRLMAAHDRSPLFAAMHDLSAETMTRLGPVNNHALLGMLRFPCQLDDFLRESLPIRYEKLFNANHPVDEHLAKMSQVGHHGRILHSRMHTAFGSAVMRYRDGRTSATLMARAPSFFSLHHGEAKLHGVRLSTLFSPGVVHMDELKKHRSGGYRLTARMEKGYNGPLSAEDLPDTARQAVSPWYLLPHHKRELTHAQSHHVQCEISRHQDGWTIRLYTDDLEDVLTQVVFLFGSECKLRSHGLAQQGNVATWKSGTLRCEAGSDWMEIESGEFSHTLTATNGFDTPISGIQVVAVNLLSPYDKTFRISLSASS